MAKAFHAAFHQLLISRQEFTLWRPAFRDGRLRPVLVTRLEMDLAIRRAQQWCGNNLNGHQKQLAAAVAARLSIEWATDSKRRLLALRAFQGLCAGRRIHNRCLHSVAARMGCSPDQLENHCLDFFLFAAAYALDDEAWQEAMTDRDAATGQPVPSMHSERIGAGAS